jgi:hypothetical protein
MIPFSPQIWQATGGDPFLVCANRILIGPEIPVPRKYGVDSPRLREFISHPVAVALDPPGILFGILDKSRARIWQIQAPDSHTRRFSAPFDTLSAQCATLALTEAWRCAGPLTLDPATLGVKMTLDGKKAENFRNGAILRNVFIWICWGKWNRDKLTLSDRLGIIASHGFSCTKKALERLLEDAGMSC